MLQPVDRLEQLRYLVLALQRDANRTLTALLRPADVTPAQAEVITVIAAAATPLTVREIGERLVCEPGSPSRLVASLVGEGLLERRPHPHDGRAAAVQLTAWGRARAEQIRGLEQRFYEQLRPRLPSERDLETTLCVLRQISEDGASARALARRT